jgi:hypothetical protein
MISFGLLPSYTSLKTRVGIFMDVLDTEKLVDSDSCVRLSMLDLQNWI